MVDGLRPCIPGGTGYPCRCGARRVACLLCRLPTLPLACFAAPIPPAPFPAGRGRFLVFLCKGLRPLHPRVQRRGAGGEAPGEINFWAPPSRREGGAGGMGEKSKLKAGRASAAGGKPPFRYHSGRVIRHRRGKPPRPPPGTGLAASARNRKENTPAGNNRRGCS